jgi:hypothetical protein
MNKLIFPPATVGVQTVQDRAGDCPSWESIDSIHGCSLCPTDVFPSASVRSSCLKPRKSSICTTINASSAPPKNMIYPDKSSSSLEDNISHGGIFSTELRELTTRVSGVKPGVSIPHNWLSFHIIATAMFTIQDRNCECFLKCDDQGSPKVMKSDVVSKWAPQAQAGDWRFKAVEYAEDDE